MVSPVVNTLRWTALTGGIVYGFVHNYSLSSAAEARAAAKKYAQKEKLIAEAKAQWASTHKKPEVTTVSTTGTFNLDDPNFDIEAYLNKALA